jgi:hypothetical protein
MQLHMADIGLVTMTIVRVPLWRALLRWPRKWRERDRSFQWRNGTLKTLIATFVFARYKLVR